MENEGILLVITLALWAAGWIVLGRVRRCGGGGTNQSVSGGLLSIIIPARNEEQNLPTLLHSLAAQAIRPREIILVNDASTDRTAEVAREFGAQVLNSQPLPRGRAGRPYCAIRAAAT